MARPNPKPPKRGRPPLVAGETKLSRVVAAVSERELEEIRRAAARAGISIGEYVRRRALH